MNYNYNNKQIRFDDEEENPKELPENPMEKMMSGWQFDKKFIEQRKIFLWGAVEDKSAKDITARLLYLEAIDPGKEITFYINSPGGVVTSGMVIYDTMQMISSPVSTVCMGMAASMGSILLSGGAKGRRFIFPSGQVMIHQPSGGGQGVSADLEIMAVQILKIKQLGARILAENCGQTYEKIMKDFDRDFWMDAKESIAYGIVDGVMNKL
ncbi:ATP-dependent Clp protease proteolytic subunit [Ferruginibacter paludis]|jgi:ATP-dependent Clp protease protease subunit|uniref:ClpP family protease n=1 Tax=Ferruginibacter TaxID=1004303 RepID=UPI0025B2D2D3|nr:MULTISPECIES: ATP-dependent Clp protease proteolytic subunit [Ferruginibacter]MDB5275196.1 Clp protease proteolytic subunit ClpP [Ferruginibacter sp.]MDN3657668.1 ATP-dependent Clp protease proteolytic subunit [Ferruginibacter paludis]